MNLFPSHGECSFFEDLSVGLLAECHSSDQRKTIRLLIRELPGFGKTTTLKMAVQADNKNFVAHPACQNLLTEIWTGKLTDDNHKYKVSFHLLDIWSLHALIHLISSAST